MSATGKKDPSVHTWFEARFSALRDGKLSAEDARSVEDHLNDCVECQQAWEAFDGAVGALSSLHKMSAPQGLGVAVEDRIRTRSAGRFFGRRTFGDRVPFGWLAVLAFAVLAAIYFVVRGSETGSLRVPDPGKAPPELAPGAKEAMPKP